MWENENGFQSCSLLEMKKTRNMHPSCVSKCHQNLLSQRVNVSSHTQMPPALVELSDKLMPGNLDLKLCLLGFHSDLLIFDVLR